MPVIPTKFGMTHVSCASRVVTFWTIIFLNYII